MTLFTLVLILGIFFFFLISLIRWEMSLKNFMYGIGLSHLVWLLAFLYLFIRLYTWSNYALANAYPEDAFVGLPLFQVVDDLVVKLLDWALNQFSSTIIWAGFVLYGLRNVAIFMIAWGLGHETKIYQRARQIGVIIMILTILM